MKKVGTFILVMALLAVMVPAGQALAGHSAYHTEFTTSVTYQNVSETQPAQVSIKFYSENSGSEINVDLGELAAGAGSSLFVGGVDQVDPGFRGSAVLVSDQPLVATMVQLPMGDTIVANRPLSNGFTSASGDNRYLVATTLKGRFDQSTIFSVQNVDTQAVDLTVNFYNADDPSAAPITLEHADLPPSASKYYDLQELGQIPDNFNGSATVEATRDDGTEGQIVATALELGTAGGAAKFAASFEGVSQGTTSYNMATALCDVFGGQQTAYAVQNTGSAATDITVTYSNGNTETKTVNPGAKASFLGCDPNSAGFSGSATISSGEPIVAIGKVFGGLASSTAFLGAPAGTSKLALPYVRWSESRFDQNQRDRQRAFIAIQNVGSDPVDGVTVEYVDKDGNTVGTHTLETIQPGAKANSTPIDAGEAAAEFGYVNGFGGGAIVTGPDGSQLTAVVRIASFPDADNFVAEDYNGISVP